MSLFLGKIHYWLYNKVLWFEGIEKEIIEMASKKSNNIENIVNNINQKYGAPIEAKPLEEIIDTSNIHGWLQQRIKFAELRQASLITELINLNSEYKVELLQIYTKQGITAARECGGIIDSPEEIYNALNDFILEGMPCDRVSEVVINNKDEFSWVTTRCLHEAYWNKVNGDVKNFYDLREVWIKAFVETINPDFKYVKKDGINRIIKP